MRMRYPIMTFLILAGALVSPMIFGSLWLLLIGLWLACVPGLMAILDNEPGPSSDTGYAPQVQFGETHRDLAPRHEQLPIAA